MLDVIIVGTGFAGSAAAILLAHAGFDVITVDKHAACPPQFRAEQIVGHQVETLDRLGLLRTIVGDRPSIAHASAWENGRWLGRFARPHYGIDYPDMVAALRAAIPTDVERHIGCVTQIETTDHSQTVTLADGTRLQGRLVVLATGLQRTLHAQLGVITETISAKHSVAIGFNVSLPSRPGDVIVFQGDAATGVETVSNLGVWYGPGWKRPIAGNGMKWRVMVELTGSDGTVRAHEVSTGGSNTAECSAATVGLTLADGKRTLAGLQDHLVRAQAEEYCRQRRVCSHCRSQRPLKDVRARRLLSVFGTVEVRAPRFSPCRCAVTRRHTLNPVAEILPDRCTPEYERIIVKMGSLLPYARARTLMSEFLPLGDVPAVETTRRRTMRVGARLEQQAVVSRPPAPAAEAQAIALSIDGGHVRSVRSYQSRSFEVMLAQVSNDDGKQVVFSSMPAEADQQQEQLRGVLHGLGATPTTLVTILSDGADGPRSLGEAASVGPTHHVLDCWCGRPPTASIVPD